MTIHYSSTNIHWNYYIAIEKDFENLSRYIDFNKKNMKTFSIELARLIMTSTQEIDVVMKKMCRILDSSKRPRNIDAYRKIIKEKCPEFIAEEITLDRFGLRSIPWKKWENNTNPTWWTANNGIKHNRDDEYYKANLNNAFNSIGGLLITILYFHKLEYEDKTGATISWKYLTNKISATRSFMRLTNDYYYEEVVI